VNTEKGLSRRKFMKLTGIGTLGITSLGFTGIKEIGIAIVYDPTDALASSKPVQWAISELEKSLVSNKIIVSRLTQTDQAKGDGLTIVVAGSGSPLAQQFLKTSGAALPTGPEVVGLIPSNSGGKQILLASGNDEQGLVYALLELCDRVNNSTHPIESLNITKSIIEQPANEVRSNTRLFVSDIEDKPWYNDREMWPEYLTMLATQRFNRFSLSFGIGYDFLQNVTDGYFVFAYPFLLPVPGYNVRVPQLPDKERDHNLEMLQYISEQTVARGMKFQLGLWMHGYEWLNSPNPNYTIEGLTAETHAPYCRDAVRELLKACPAISGVTFRVHGESGVTEGSYNFWKTVFDGVATCGRTVAIDMHAKGMDQNMIDMALATGLPITISPKYWAEHLGMPYHQADIRAIEVPKPGVKNTGLMALSAGSRSFIRYGYGDLLNGDRKYKVVHRIWPGTQRLLLWGDPLTSAAHSRAFSFCGSAGVEMMEPLSFKGRRGSGIAGDRCGYADATLKPRWDWQKYLYSYRIFGRLTYNPDAAPEIWQRTLNEQFDGGALAVGAAIANATRILPTILTAHGPSAANNNYWPEVYTNQSIVDPKQKSPYSDSLAPKVFGNVSPFDPQLFMRINEFAAELLKGERSGKYTPVEVAQWIEDYALHAARNLAKAGATVKNKQSAEYRRMVLDVTIQAGLGNFFGAKFRSALLYSIFEQSGDRSALELALTYYQKARNYWSDFANIAAKSYQSDITVGEKPDLRGNWLNRLSAIDEDIALMANLLKQTVSSTGTQNKVVQLAIQEAIGRPVRTTLECRSIVPEKFIAGQPLEIELSFEKTPKLANLYYRHVNQAERWEKLEMKLNGKSFNATIPADYTTTSYPIAYYFEFKESHDKAGLYPGLKEDLINQPYFVIRKS